MPTSVYLTPQRLRAVVFDVDFTLALPGPELGPEGYRALGARYGLDLDPARYDDARAAAFAALERHPELDHDEAIWVLFTQRIIEGMSRRLDGGGQGGRAETYAAAVELTRAWDHAHHFELYEDVLPTLGELRRRGYRLGLLSNTARDLDAFVAHHGIDVDAVLTSSAHGKTKPHASIFLRLLELLGTDAAETLMVGDSLDDDIEGARSVGMPAVLLDRGDRYPDLSERLRGLAELLESLP
jgi:HAD superfamily hydrolase (TIGR01549 family)